MTRIRAFGAETLFARSAIWPHTALGLASSTARSEDIVARCQRAAQSLMIRSCARQSLLVPADRPGTAVNGEGEAHFGALHRLPGVK